VLGYRLLKCKTSKGANYREANRAQSSQDFIYKIVIVDKEASETQYWLEFFDALQIGDPRSLAWLLLESREMLAIFTCISQAAKRRQKIIKV